MGLIVRFLGFDDVGNFDDFVVPGVLRSENRVVEVAARSDRGHRRWSSPRRSFASTAQTGRCCSRSCCRSASRNRRRSCEMPHPLRGQSPGSTTRSRCLAAAFAIYGRASVPAAATASELRSTERLVEIVHIRLPSSLLAPRAPRRRVRGGPLRREYRTVARQAQLLLMLIISDCRCGTPPVVNRRFA